jgi:Tfp pilus assembly protein PilV
MTRSLLRRLTSGSRLLPGQSLIELIIAMFVIIVGLVAAGSVIFANARAEERSLDRVFATNLAREGVEIAKAVRDSNWVSGGATSSDAGLYSGTDYTGVPRMDGGVFIDFDFTPNAFTDTATQIKVSTNAGSPGLYVQGTGASGNATAFSRLVTLSPICSDYTTRASGSSCGALTKIGVRVNSQVRWSRRDGAHTSTIEEDLYDWR